MATRRSQPYRKRAGRPRSKALYAMLRGRAGVGVDRAQVRRNTAKRKR